MPMKQLLDLTALELSNAITRGEVSCTQAAQAALEAANQTNTLNAFITLTPEQALNYATELDRAPMRTPLFGVPYAIKDNLCTAGIPTTCASRMLQNFVPPYTATAVDQLTTTGAVSIGKTNLDEFAIGSTSETSFFGPVKNPWNLDYSPGGSSGGSAAAVAAGAVWFALGSDTGGSIRHPAACCGVTGMKPTYGTVSRYGLVAYASSFDQIGPICRDAADCAAVLDSIRGHDPRDSTSLPGPYDNLSTQLIGNLRGVRIGIPDVYFNEAVDSETRQAILACADVLRQQGALVELCCGSGLEDAVHAYYVLACTQASSNLARYDGVRYGFRAQDAQSVQQLFTNSRTLSFGQEVKRRILLGTYLLSDTRYETHYKKAVAVRHQVEETFRNLWQRYDLLLTPVMPSTPPRLGQETNDSTALYQEDTYVACANLAGLPALAIPCGMRENGLPIGAQLLGPRMGDGLVLNAAYSFQQATDWHRLRPSMFALGGGTL